MYLMIDLRFSFLHQPFPTESGERSKGGHFALSTCDFSNPADSFCEAKNQIVFLSATLPTTPSYQQRRCPTISPLRRQARSISFSGLKDKLCTNFKIS
jgi:hypothetical protein